MGAWDLAQTAWDWVGDNMASILAVCALCFTAYQTKSTWRHNRLSVKPHLDSFNSRTMGPNEGHIVYSLINNGLGPAIIESFVVTLDGAPINLRVPLELEAAMNRLLGSRPRTFSVGNLAVGSAMRRDESREILKLRFPASNQAEFDGVESQLARLRVKVAYRSLYDERLTFDSEGANDR